MIATLRESKAKLSEFVARVAAYGEEIVITVRGKPMARLCPISPVSPHRKQGLAHWGESLREARAAYSIGTHDTGTEILDKLRGESGCCALEHAFAD